MFGFLEYRFFPAKQTETKNIFRDRTANKSYIEYLNVVLRVELYGVI